MSVICHSFEYIKLLTHDIYNNSVDKWGCPCDKRNPNNMFFKKEIGNSMEKGPYQNCRRHVCRFGTCAALLPTATYYYLLLSAKEKGFYHTGNLIYQQNCCRCRFVQVLCTQANDISLTCLLFLVSSCEPFCTYTYVAARQDNAITQCSKCGAKCDICHNLFSN